VASEQPQVVPGLDADLTGGSGREFRMVGEGDSSHLCSVCELTENAGLVVRIGGLLRWQALAIVSILHPPFD
jgi:hypothetical protein